MINPEKDERTLLAQILRNPQESFDAIYEADFRWLDEDNDPASPASVRADLYAMLEGMYAASEPINEASIKRAAEYKPNSGNWMREIDAVIGIAPTVSAADCVANILSTHTRNRLAFSADGIKQIAGDTSLTVEQVIARSGDVINGFTMQHPPADMQQLSERMAEAQAAAARGELRLMTTGHINVDPALMYEPNGYYIISGKGGSCKTTLAMEGAKAQAEQGIKADIYSMEQTAQQIYENMVCRHAGYNYIRLMKGEIAPDDRSFKAARDHIASLPITIFDGSYSAQQIKASIKRRVAQGLCDITYVDYLQCIRGRPKLSEYERITESSSALREAAKDYGKPVVAISSLSNDGHLRGSGNIFFDAYGVIELERDQESEITEGKLTVTKNRFGSSSFSIGWRMNENGGVHV